MALFLRVGALGKARNLVVITMAFLKLTVYDFVDFHVPKTAKVCKLKLSLCCNQCNCQPTRLRLSME